MASTNNLITAESIDQYTPMIEVGIVLPESRVSLRSNCRDILAELSRRLAPFVEVVSGRLENPNLEMIVLNVGSNEIPWITTWQREVIQSHPKIDRYNRSVLRAVVNGCTVTVNERSGTLCIVDPKERVIMMKNSKEGELVKDARRLLRDINVGENRQNGYATLHAAGVVVNDESVLICGPAGSGKTNLMIDMLSLGRTDYLSNDGAFVKIEGATVKSLGVPEHILVRPGVLGRVDKLRDYLPSIYQGKPLSYLWAISDAEKVSIQYQDLVRIFGCSVIASAKVRAIILPQFRQGFMPARFTPAAKEDLRTALTASYEEPVEHSRQPWHGLFKLEFDSIRSNQQKIESFLINNIPAYRLIYGERSSLDAARIALDRIFRVSRVPTAQSTCIQFNDSRTQNDYRDTIL